MQGIILTGNPTVENAVEALCLDAFEYLERAFDSAAHFRLTLQRALERRRLLAENKRLFQETQLLAPRDPLTDLYNRRHMQSVLGVELDRVRRYGRKLSTIMIDIDDLKSLNDRHGHAAGDEVLRQLAHVMRDNMRGSDIPIRLGGDEFLVLLSETGIERAIGAAERIAEASREIRCEGDPVYFSIGISEWGPAIESIEAFLEKADQALYEAKDAGGRRFRAGDRMIPARRRPLLLHGGRAGGAAHHGHGAQPVVPLRLPLAALPARLCDSELARGCSAFPTNGALRASIGLTPREIIKICRLARAKENGGVSGLGRWPLES